MPRDATLDRVPRDATKSPSQALALCSSKRSSGFSWMRRDRAMSSSALASTARVDGCGEVGRERHGAGACANLPARAPMKSSVCCSRCSCLRRCSRRGCRDQAPPPAPPPTETRPDAPAASRGCRSAARASSSAACGLSGPFRPGEGDGRGPRDGDPPRLRELHDAQVDAARLHALFDAATAEIRAPREADDDLGPDERGLAHQRGRGQGGRRRSGRRRSTSSARRSTRARSAAAASTSPSRRSTACGSSIRTSIRTRPRRPT